MGSPSLQPQLPPQPQAQQQWQSTYGVQTLGEPSAPPATHSVLAQVGQAPGPAAGQPWWLQQQQQQLSPFEAAGPPAGAGQPWRPVATRAAPAAAAVAAIPEHAAAMYASDELEALSQTHTGGKTNSGPNR